MQPTQLRQQRATKAVFFVPGFLIASWAPLVPFAKARANLTDADLGILLLCLGLGSIMAMPFAGQFAAKYGCRRVMLIAIAILVILLPCLTMTGSAVAIGVALFGFGAAMGSMDVVINMQAVAVEKESSQPMMSGFHAFYSIGSLMGAAVMTLLLSSGVGVTATTLFAAAIAVSIAVKWNAGWRRERIPKADRQFQMPRGVLLLIGLLMFLTFYIEGSMLDWSAVFLHEVRGVDVAHAGWGFVTFNLAMTVMRLMGDRIVGRLGQARMILLGGFLACSGMLFIVVAPSFGWTILGFAILGIGEANIIPILFTYAGRQTLIPASVAVPTVSTLGYAGVLLGPALIGWIADQWSLSVAFALSAFILAFVAVVGASLQRLGHSRFTA